MRVLKTAYGCGIYDVCITCDWIFNFAWVGTIPTWQCWVNEKNLTWLQQSMAGEDTKTIMGYCAAGVLVLLIIVAAGMLFSSSMSSCGAKPTKKAIKALDPRAVQAARKLRESAKNVKASKKVESLQKTIQKARQARNSIKQKSSPEATKTTEVKRAQAPGPNIRAPKDSHPDLDVKALLVMRMEHEHDASAHRTSYDLNAGGLKNAQELSRQKRLASRIKPLQVPAFKEKLKDLEADAANAAVSVCGGVPPAGSGEIEGILKCTWNPDQSTGCSGAGISSAICLDEESAWGPKRLTKLFSNPYTKTRDRNVKQDYGTLFKQKRFGADHPLHRLPDLSSSFRGVCNLPASGDASMMPIATEEADCNGLPFCNLHCSNFNVEGDLFDLQAVALPKLLKFFLQALTPGGSYDESEKGMFIDVMDISHFDSLVVEAVQPRLQLTPGCDLSNAPNCRPRELINYSKANIYCAVSSNGGKYIAWYAQALMDLLLVKSVVDGAGVVRENSYHISNLWRMGSTTFNRLITVLLASSSASVEQEDLLLAFVDAALQGVAEIALKSRYSCNFNAHMLAESFATLSYDQGKPKTVGKIMEAGNYKKVSEGNPKALIWAWRHWK